MKNWLSTGFKQATSPWISHCNLVPTCPSSFQLVPLHCPELCREGPFWQQVPGEATQKSFTPQPFSMLLSRGLPFLERVQQLTNFRIVYPTSLSLVRSGNVCNLAASSSQNQSKQCFWFFLPSVFQTEKLMKSPHGCWGKRVKSVLTN